MKLLLNGVPCCGKTSFGDWLRDNHGYRHFNLEDGNWAAHMVEFANAFGRADLPLPSWVDKVVVTWGFIPDEVRFSFVEQFVSVGFAAWWFDGDLKLAREQYLVRDGEQRTIEFFDPQARRLKDAREKIARVYSGRMLTTLSPDGYLSRDEILSKLSQ